ncbi:MAG TPA: DUF1998 domain-containing protein [Anaerolineae bacterium]|nr:DUF1998 domain-containing protein [Anaerolineae bacterium]
MVGIAEKGFDLLGDLWRATYEAVRDCPCADGCPSCVQVSRSGSQLDAWRKIWAASLQKGWQPRRSYLFGGVAFAKRRQKCQSFSGPALRT